MKKSILEKIKARSLKKRLSDTIDEKHDKMAADARLKWEARWRARTEEITGEPCTRWEDIAFDD